MMPHHLRGYFAVAGRWTGLVVGGGFEVTGLEFGFGFGFGLG